MELNAPFILIIMLHDHSLIDFKDYTPDDMVAGAIQNIENINSIVEEINKIKNISKDAFLTIYVGVNGGTLKPIIISFPVFYEFLKDSSTISEAINKMANGKG